MSITQRILIHSDMNVDSNNMEFGSELTAVVPYAYWHYKNGLLDMTRSARGSDPFYYFSPLHVINPLPRHAGNIWPTKIPNKEVREFTGEGKWMAPPYRSKYMNKEHVYDKPILVIANKYNMEWGRDPVNYLDLKKITFILNKLGDKYTVFYNRRMPDYLKDDQLHKDLGEHNFIRQVYPDVRFIDEMEGDYNINQLRVYANCDHFISVQGGNSILASYFGGTNIVYAVKGNELSGGFYHKIGALSGCEVVHVREDFYQSIYRYES